MKKIISLLLAIVMIVSMIPAQFLTVRAAETATSSMAVVGTTGVLASDSSSISWTNNTITFTNYKAGSSTAIRTSDSAHYRVYAKSEVEVVAPGNITSIAITSAGSSYYTPWQNSAGTIGTATLSGSVITVVPTTPATSIKFAVTAQVRLSNIEVTYEVAGADTGCAHANVVDVEAVAATCTTPGFTAGKQCTDCEAYTEGHEVVAATGHAYGEWVDTTAATCTEAGEQSATCANCGDVKTQAVAALGHNYVDNTCTVCGDVTVMANYELVTDAASLKAGDQLIVVGANDAGAYSVMIPYASGNNLKAESISAPVDGKVSLADTSAAAVITLGGDSTGWTFFDGTYYLYAAGAASSNHLKGQAELPTDNTGNWTIAIDADGNATIVSVGNTGDGARNTIKFNYGNSPVLFSCYKADYATKVSPVSIYRLTTGESVEPEPSEPTDPSEPEVSEPDTTEFEGEVDTTDPTEAPAEDGYVIADSIAAGDTVIIVAKAKNMELSGFSTTSTVYGLGTAYEGTPAGVMTWTVEEGTVDGSFSLKNSDGKYLYWSSGNSLKVNAAKDAQSSWNITFDGENAVVVNAGTVDAARHIGWNNSSPRFANYKDSTLSGTGYSTIQFYKYVEAPSEHVWSDWTQTVAPGCTTEGEESRTCSHCDEVQTRPVEATGHNYESVITPPTTEAQGYTTHTCTVCGDTYVDSYIDPIVVIENGTYVIYTAEGSAMTALDETYNYGFMNPTAITVADGVVSGHTNQNIFTVTAIGDGTYTIQDTYGKYLYMMGTFNSFNVGAELPEEVAAEAAAWAFSSADNGAYYITNVAMAKTIGIGLKSDGTSYGTFGAYTDEAQQKAMYLIAVSACAHTNTTTETVAATCTAPGSETVSCADCGEIISVTEIPAIGHDFQDGVCANCGKEDPALHGLRYYIAAIREEGNYFYMTDDLGTASTSRYQAVDSGLATLPTCITAPEQGNVFVLVENEDGTYSLYAERACLYLGWTSENSGILVEEEDALKLTVDKLEDGTYNIRFVTSETSTDGTPVERYLSLNKDVRYGYYAWYKGTQLHNLSLIPVCEHDDSVPTPAVAATYTTTGLTEGSHCATCGAIYVAQQVVPVLENPVTGWNITLGDSIGVNFEMTLAATDTVKVYLNGEEIASTLVGGKLTVVLAAAQMTDEITIKVNDMVTSVDPYTVRKYADVILADETEADCHALVKEMLNYGAASQTFFGHTGTLANEGITVEAAAVPTEGGDVSVSGSVDGITFYGASLLHKDKIAVRFYFQADSIDGMTFTVNGETCEAVPHENGMFYVEVAGINPQNMDDDIVVMVNEELTVSYSPMDYIIRMYNKADSSAELKALVQALYGYYAAAEAYTA